VRFENKNTYFFFEKRSSLLQCWRGIVTSGVNRTTFKFTPATPALLQAIAFFKVEKIYLLSKRTRLRMVSYIFTALAL
jgi:hypothetical protein